MREKQGKEGERAENEVISEGFEMSLTGREKTAAAAGREKSGNDKRKWRQEGEKKGEDTRKENWR